MNRRHFLSAVAAASVAPALLLPKRAFAATPGFGATKHVILLYAKGGLRSHCLFNAVGAAPHVNPFGVQADRAGREWKLGAAAGTASWTFTGTSTETVPSFDAISPDVTVIGTLDHVPGGVADVDHRTASNRIATGDPEGLTGILALFGKDHPMYAANGFSLTSMPPVEVGMTELGRGAGTYANTRPLSLGGAEGSFETEGQIGKGWHGAARHALDARFRDSRSRAYRYRLDRGMIAKKNVAIFGGLLQDPLISVIDQPEAAAHGVTNAQLLEVLGNEDLSSPGEYEGARSWGADVALALRLIGKGSPACSVTRDIYDLHDGEASAFVPRASDLCRQLAGLHFLLHRMPHPDGGTFWDKTIVCTMSEFSRNNTGASGFNSGNGSDHVTEDAGACRNQAIALMGGPIAAAKGKLLGPTDANIDAIGPVFESKRLLATLVDALGINQSYFGVDPIQELYT